MRIPAFKLTVTCFDQGSDSVRFFHAAHAKSSGAATNGGQGATQLQSKRVSLDQRSVERFDKTSPPVRFVQD